MNSSLIRRIRAPEFKGLIESSSNMYWRDESIILESRLGKVILNFTDSQEFCDCNMFVVKFKRVSGNGLIMVSCGSSSQEYQIISRSSQEVSCSFVGQKIQFNRTQRSTGEVAICEISMYHDVRSAVDWNKVIKECSSYSCLRMIGDQLHAASGAWVKGKKIKVQTVPANSYTQNGDEVGRRGSEAMLRLLKRSTTSFQPFFLA